VHSQPRKPPSPAASPLVDINDRDRMEIIRFAMDEDQLQAIGILRERGMLNLSSTRHDE
jgi:hypothetical protein